MGIVTELLLQGTDPLLQPLEPVGIGPQELSNRAAQPQALGQPPFALGANPGELAVHLRAPLFVLPAGEGVLQVGEVGAHGVQELDHALQRRHLAAVLPARQLLSFSSLGNGILDLRKIFEGLYRPENIESLGFPARLARDSKLLLRQGGHLIEVLTSSDLELPDSRFADAGLPISEMVKSLVPKVEELRKALGDIGREERLAQVTQVDRDRATDDYNNTFLWVARTLESLYSLSGEKELAARVRPSTRRPGRTERQVVEEEGGEVANEPSTPPTDDADA